MAKVVATEEQLNIFLNVLSKAKKPKEKKYSRNELLNDNAFCKSIKKLRERGFSTKDIIAAIKDAAQEADFSSILEYHPKEIEALLEDIEEKQEPAEVGATQTEEIESPDTTLNEDKE